MDPDAFRVYVSNRPIVRLPNPANFEKTIYDSTAPKSLRWAPRQKLGAFHINRQDDDYLTSAGGPMPKMKYFPTRPGVIPREQIPPKTWTPYI